MARPTIVDFPAFNAEQDSKELRGAMKGMGTKEAALITILCQRSHRQLRVLETVYQQSFGRVLLDDLKSELSGKVRDVLLSLFHSPAEYDAFILKKAVKGLGTDEAAIIEIMCTRNNDEVEAINEAYQRMYETELQKDLSSDTSGDFRKLLLSLCAGHRDEGSPPNDKLALQEAVELYDAGQKRLGTDEEVFNRVFAQRSWRQLKLTFQHYKSRYSAEIFDVIKSEFSGWLCEALIVIAKTAILGREKYFCELLESAIKGVGTDDAKLTRVIVSRRQVDLRTVAEIFEKRQKKSLHAAVAVDTSGDYKKALLKLIKGNS